MQIERSFVPGLPRAGTVASPATSGAVANRPGQGASNFASNLSDALKEVNRQQLQATASTEQSARGGGQSMDQLMVQTQEASLAFHMSMQFRNKALEAYQDVMKMQF